VRRGVESAQELLALEVTEVRLAGELEDLGDREHRPVGDGLIQVHKLIT
jgi:hypothetical protein